MITAVQMDQRWMRLTAMVEIHGCRPLNCKLAKLYLAEANNKQQQETTYS